MTERAWRFGDVVRVDPAKNSLIPQPDDRRWMIVSFNDRVKWTLVYIGPGLAYATHWPNVHGFIRVEDDE